MKRAMILISALLLCICTAAQADSSVSTFAELKAAVEGVSGTAAVSLAADIDVTGKITVPAGASVTLNGNGHTLQRTAANLGIMIEAPEGAALIVKDTVFDGGADGWTVDAGKTRTARNGQFYYAYSDSDLKATGAMLQSAGTLTVSGCTMQNISSSCAVSSTGTLTVEDSTVKHGIGPSSFNAPGIRASGTANPVVTIRNTTFSEMGGMGTGLGSALTASGVTLHVEGCTFEDCFSRDDGGAVALSGATSFRFTDTVFRGNFCNNDGSAMDIRVGGNISEALFKNCTFEGNVGTRATGTDMGTIYFWYWDKKNPATFDHCTFTNNVADAGGAISNYSGSLNLTIKDCTFTSNRATYNNNKNGGGGAAYLQGEGTAVFRNCTFDGNEAGGGAGCVETLGDFDLTFKDDTFTNNKASYGGVILAYNPEGTKTVSTVENCTFDGNSASDRGGVLYNHAKSKGSIEQTVTDCTFTNNTSVNSAGVIYNYANTDGTDVRLTVRDSKFIGNKSTGTESSYGGVLYASTAAGSTAEVSVSNCVVRSNSSGNGGGAFNVSGNTTLDVSNLDITNCSSENGAAVRAYCGEGFDTTVNLNNVGIRNNTASGNAAVCASGGVNLNLVKTVITKNHSTASEKAGGGVALLSGYSGVSFTMDGASKIYNNTSDRSADDVFLSGRDTVRSFGIIDAEKMNVKDLQGYKIDGWYYDEPDNRYVRGVSAEWPEGDDGEMKLYLKAASSLTQIDLTITAKDQTIARGEEISKELTDAFSEGLADGDRISELTFRADEKNGKIYVSAAVILDADGNDVTSKYNIRYIPGSLIILDPADVPHTGDGTPLAALGAALVLSFAGLAALNRRRKH